MACLERNVAEVRICKEREERKVIDDDPELRFQESRIFYLARCFVYRSSSLKEMMGCIH